MPMPQAESERPEPEPAALGKAAQQAEQEILDALAGIGQARAQHEAWTSRADIGQVFPLGQRELLEWPKSSEWRVASGALLKQPFEERVHAFMAQKFYDIREVLQEFDCRLSDVEQRTESMLQSRQPDITQRFIQPRVESRMQSMMQDHWWSQVGDAMQWQIQSLRDTLEEKASKLAKLEEAIAGDSAGRSVAHANEKSEVRMASAHEAQLSDLRNVVASFAEEFRAEVDDLRKSIEETRSIDEDSLQPMTQKREASVSSANSIVELAVEQHQHRQSVMERKERGVTVDFLEHEAQEIYHFDESTWDIAIFIGTPSLGFLGSALTSVLLLMNVMMQFVYTAIVFYNFSEPQIGNATIEAARSWRQGTAHAYTWLESELGSSLVARVCGFDDSLMSATAQSTRYKQMYDYVKPDATGLEAHFVGKWLCVVALLCWYLMVSKEVHNTLDLFRAVAHLPRGHDKLEPREIPMQATQYEVVSMSFGRILLSGIIASYRLAIACLLAYCGTIFLVYTIDITELVLNAVALEIILNVDDLLFDAMTTANARDLVDRLIPLKMPRWPHCRGVDLKACGMAIILPVSLAFVYIGLLSPMVDDIDSISEQLCGGNRDFVYHENQLRMAEMVPTTPFGEQHITTNSPESSLNTSASSHASVPVARWVIKKAIIEATRQETESDRQISQFAFWDGSVRDLKLRMPLPQKEYIDVVTRGECRDQTSGFLFAYLQQTMGNRSIASCREVKQYCESLSVFPSWDPDDGKGIMARMVCPETCHCDNPLSLNFINSGCPKMCTSMQHSKFATHLDQIRCVQPKARESGGPNASWKKSYGKQLREYGILIASDLFVEMAARWEKEEPCEIGKFPPYTKCQLPADAPFKDFNVFCPRLCNCQSQRHGGWGGNNCPLECFEYRFHRRRRRITTLRNGTKLQAALDYGQEKWARENGWPPPQVICTTEDIANGCCRRESDRIC